MESDLENEYKKKQFIHAIKTGKIPTRSGLGTRLYLLAGYTKNRPYCTLENCEPPLLEHPKKEHFTKRLCYSKHVYSMENGEIEKHLHSKDMINVFDKYLKNYEIVRHWAYVFVYFDPKNSPSWAILDEDLKNKYPNNYIVDKRGFIQYK
jgi:hypothetical protein